MKHNILVLLVTAVFSVSLHAGEISDPLMWSEFVDQIVQHEIFHPDDEDGDDFLTGSFQLLTPMGYRVLSNGDHYGLAVIVRLSGTMDQKNRRFALDRGEVSFIEIPYCDYIYQVDENYRNRTLNVVLDSDGLVHESSELLRYNQDRVGRNGGVIPANNGQCNDISKEAEFMPIQYSSAVDSELLNVLRFITGRRVIDPTIRPYL
jgi:hypothetical protein